MNRAQRSSLLSVLGLTVALGSTAGCDNKSSAPEPTPTAEAKAPETKADTKTEAEAEAANPHTAMMGHGGATPSPEAEKKGPPRDVTPSGETTEAKVAELVLAVPKEWEKGEASSPMRMAEYTLPGPGGDAELVVYRFKGGAGGVEENVARWKGQFQPPEGKSIDDVSKVETVEVGDLKVTMVDISGRFVAAVRPGAPAKHDEPDYRMLAAIVEGSGDPFFLKATGPGKTLEVWAESFRTMIEGLKVG